MKFLFSSIGKKIQMAISGILFCVFLLFQLFNNLVLFAGSDTFNQMVGFLESIKPIIRFMEFGLLFILLIHIFNAIQVTLLNRNARKVSYMKNDLSSTTSYNSRIMIFSGLIILLFVFFHLFFIWGTYQSHSYFAVGETYYDVLIRNQLGYLGHTGTAIFYIVSIVLIGSHLKHGFQSALKTFGILHNSKWGLLYHLGVIFWGIIPAGFIIIIIAIQMEFIK